MKHDSSAKSRLGFLARPASLAMALAMAIAPLAASAQDTLRTALPFQAVDTDSKPLSFPSDYKGRVVLLDFWATWCGPCVGEVPGLVAAYSKYHDKGFEVLGISLDQANSLEKLRAFTVEYGMTWRQVYDGKFWQARIARFYRVDSIPRAFLVDGDTGKILASGDSLRGASLDGTLAKALAAKKKI